ncbi:MAG: hypothetical protein O3A57_12335, partial [Bacteroidetes bacterium]|nr:hypothetical protein [Bacteroidota bacterium]
MRSFLVTYGKEIFALTVPFVAWGLNYFFRAKAKLNLSIPHAFTFLVQQPLVDADGNEISPSQTVNTRSLVISNAGRITATQVELVFNWKPICINIWPPRHFEEHMEPDGRFTIKFESLAPSEQFGCELLVVNANLPDLLTARCEQCVAKEVHMYPQPHVEPWKLRVAAILLFAGAALLLYFLMLVLQFVLV